MATYPEYRVCDNCHKLQDLRQFAYLEPASRQRDEIGRKTTCKSCTNARAGGSSWKQSPLYLRRES